jgi:predicted Zn-dependent protease
MVSKFFRFMRSLAIAAVLLPGIALSQAASAQPSNVTQIRDAEIENTIRAYAIPIFQAARLDTDAVRVILVNDSSINAFVAGGQRLFIFTGLLMKATSAGQVIGVIAHETGHIAGGHLARLREELDNRTIEFIIEQILTVAAAGAASSAGGGIHGGNNSGPAVGVTERSLLLYSRTQESAADQAATVFLDRSRISTRGLLTFSEMLLQRERVAGLRPDPYLRTHPLTQDRVAFLQHHVDVSPYSNTPVAPQLEVMHQRMLAKLYGFIDPGQAFRKYPASDNSLPARYARAIAYYKSGNPQQGLSILDGLIRENPNDPYFHELRGQILFENQRIAESVPAYEKAVALLPSSNLLKIGLAQSLIELNDATRTQQALKLLNSVSDEERNTSYWRLVAVAYDRLGNVGMRLLAQAELGYARGKAGRGEALQNARRAMQTLPKGSPGWQRAQDIEFLAQKKKDE